MANAENRLPFSPQNQSLPETPPMSRRGIIFKAVAATALAASGELTSATPAAAHGSTTGVENFLIQNFGMKHDEAEATVRAILPVATLTAIVGLTGVTIVNHVRRMRRGPDPDEE